MIASAKLRLTLVLVMASLMPLTATSLTAQEVLTNESVVALKKAGLSDPLILTKIRTSPAKFDVSTKGLIALKSAGLVRSDHRGDGQPSRHAGERIGRAGGHRRASATGRPDDAARLDLPLDRR